MIARNGSKHHGMCQSLVLLVFLASIGCKPSTQKPKPAAETPAKKAKSATPEQPPPAPIKPVDLGPLAAGSVSEVLSKLQQAHYDPVTLGLQELRYQVSYFWARHDVHAKAEGRWSQDKGPDVVLLQVTRNGKVQYHARADQVGKEIWSSIKEGIESLLKGLGHGFLSERLKQWAEMKGPNRTVQLKGDRLVLNLGGEDGTYEVTVGPGYQILEVAHHSPEGVVRKMTYSYRTEQGRNLVTRAVLSTEVPKGAGLADEVRDVVQSSQGMSFSLTYSKVGRYWLPTHLEKDMPATKDHLTLSLTYLEARP